MHGAVVRNVNYHPKKKEYIIDKIENLCLSTGLITSHGLLGAASRYLLCARSMTFSKHDAVI